MIKSPPANAGDAGDSRDVGSIPGLGRSPGGGEIHILAWEISWTEEPGGLQSMGSQTVGHNYRLNNNNKYRARWDAQCSTDHRSRLTARVGAMSPFQPSPGSGKMSNKGASLLPGVLTNV